MDTLNKIEKQIAKREYLKHEKELKRRDGLSDKESKTLLQIAISNLDFVQFDGIDAQYTDINKG